MNTRTATSIAGNIAVVLFLRDTFAVTSIYRRSSATVTDGHTTKETDERRLIVLQGCLQFSDDTIVLVLCCILERPLEVAMLHAASTISTLDNGLDICGIVHLILNIGGAPSV